MSPAYSDCPPACRGCEACLTHAQAAHTTERVVAAPLVVARHLAVAAISLAWTILGSYWCALSCWVSHPEVHH